MEKGTPFELVYDLFLSKITDDMYMELTEQETYAMLQELLVSALPYFEFPRQDIDSYELSFSEDEGYYTGVESNYNTVRCIFFGGGYFLNNLTFEEINIIATYMIVIWIDQQLASVEVTRMKYSGSDFKFTSQANHIAKLSQLKKEYVSTGFHLQRLYKRRKKNSQGIYESTMSMLMEVD